MVSSAKSSVFKQLCHALSVFNSATQVTLSGSVKHFRLALRPLSSFSLASRQRLQQRMPRSMAQDSSAQAAFQAWLSASVPQVKGTNENGWNDSDDSAKMG